MTGMIEQVARDIAKSCCPWVEPERIAKYVDDSWRCYELNAIAAIKAMREPSEEVTRAGGNVHFYDIKSKRSQKIGEYLAHSAYTEMLNAALGEHA